MKKFFCFLIVLACALVVMSTAVLAANDITVKVGGYEMWFDVKPQVIDQRVMLPVRKVFEEIGAKVKYVAEDNTVVATKMDTVVEIFLDKPLMTINGEQKQLDVAPVVIKGRTLIPVRACAEAFGLKVEWDNDTKTVTIKKPVSVLYESSYGDKYVLDDNGNTIYYTSDEYFCRYEYDEKGNMLHMEDSNGYVCDYAYDNRGNITYRADSEGNWEKRIYDENGNFLYSEDADGWYCKYEYDEKGNPIYEEYSDGTWYRSEYDENDNEVLCYSSNGYSCSYVYDDNGNMIFSQDNNGYWMKTQYDASGRELSWEDSDGYGYTYEYDSNGNQILYKNRSGYETRKIYDEWGNFVMEVSKDSNGYETYYEYRYDGYGNKIYSGAPDGSYYSIYEYDSEGNLIYEENDDGAWWKYVVIEK